MPNVVGALIGKAPAVAKISSQSAANREKHFRGFDSLARLLGPHDRATADLSKGEKELLGGLLTAPGLSGLAVASLDLMLCGPTSGQASRSQTDQ